MSTRFAPIRQAPRRWAPALGMILIALIALLAGITLP